MKYIIFALALLFPAVALAQSKCGPYEQVEQALDKVGERRIAVWNMSIGGIELWVSPTTHTMTLIGRPNDNPEMGCLIMDGEDFRPSKPNPVGRPS